MALGTVVPSHALQTPTTGSPRGFKEQEARAGGTGCIHFMLSRIHMAMDPRISTIPGRSTGRDDTPTPAYDVTLRPGNNLQ